ncbi:MAG: proline--tRNA ligase [Candidatus Nealsonbacteria bacterium]|nr:proline--tRNA ligase [Candidatus Nealsonbacteria bacterium]
MLQSKLFCKAKKTAPKDAEAISHQYLARADFIEQSMSGVYRFLPLGFRVLKKIEEIIRREMIELGAQELYLPVFQNKNLWLETKRWETFDPPLFKIKDRHQKETALGSTHEEEITDIFRKRIKSYQDFPLYLFQIQNKFRNEMRFSGGLMRVREFLMKDLYSFHSSEEDLIKFYEKVKKSYFKIFKKCGLKPICVEASSGTIGGDLSHEFMVPCSIGEDRVLICKNCGFAANIEKIGEIKDCPKCKSQLEKNSCIEIGHVFNLGTKYTKAMNAEYLDKSGKNHFPLMGCYGIGLHRLVATIVETNHDEKGIIWPEQVAPFDVHLIQVEDNAKVRKGAEGIYRDLQKKGIEVLYDDRGKSAGEKFAEADLIGLPLRIVVSERTLKNNCAEVKNRNKKEAKMIKVKELAKFLC